MDIYVYDKAFNILGVIDQFTSLIWRRAYYKSGTFELHLFLPSADEEAAEMIAMLQKGNIIIKDDDSGEAGYIENIKLDDETNEVMVVSGYFTDNFIKERFVWGTQQYSGSIEHVMKSFVSNNCITPTNPNRILPYLTLSETRGINISANEVNSYSNLSEIMEELAIKYNVGWRVLFDLTNQKYLFDVYQGKDISINQTVNPQAIFSLEFENVTNQSYTDSDSNYKNMALIGGQGEGIARKLVTINDNLSGFDRRELFVDANDIAPEDENGNPISDTEYNRLLEERGKSKLAEMQPISTFESGISVLSNLIYKQDFDLGDKVTIENNRWGLIINTRITTVEEVYENNQMDVRVNFGSNIPTLIDKIKRKMR